VRRVAIGLYKSTLDASFPELEFPEQMV